jgi:biopolymer transport protein ExbD
MNFSDKSKADEEIVLEMTPLIDIVFQLLIFFMLTTTFAVNVKQGGLELDLPKAKSTDITSMAGHVTIAILKDGRTVIDGEELSETELKNKLSRIHKKNPKTMVVVQADRMVPHWQVVKVMDMAATQKLKRLGIATVEE